MPAGAVRIDRRTRWGNPYRISPEATREEVIRRYRAYLRGRIRSGAIPLRKIAALHGKPLACWCHPKPCHGEVLAEEAARAHHRLEAGRAAAASPAPEGPGE